MGDAGHNLSDVFGLLVAWAASIASKRAQADGSRTGFAAHRSSRHSETQSFCGGGAIAAGNF